MSLFYPLPLNSNHGLVTARVEDMGQGGCQSGEREISSGSCSFITPTQDTGVSTSASQHATTRLQTPSSSTVLAGILLQGRFSSIWTRNCAVFSWDGTSAFKKKARKLYMLHYPRI